SSAEVLKMDCDRKTATLVREDYFDRDDNWGRVVVPPDTKPAAMEVGSAIETIWRGVCDSVSGTYDGLNSVTYGDQGRGAPAISIIVEQHGSRVDVTFQTGSGAGGVGSGRLTGTTVD